MTGQTERLRNGENYVNTLTCNPLTELQVRSCSLYPTCSWFTKGEGYCYTLGYRHLTQIRAKQLTSLILVLFPFICQWGWWWSWARSSSLEGRFRWNWPLLSFHCTTLTAQKQISFWSLGRCIEGLNRNWKNFLYLLQSPTSFKLCNGGKWHGEIFPCWLNATWPFWLHSGYDYPGSVHCHCTYLLFSETAY